MTNESSRTDTVGDSFTVEYVCTCGERHTEYFGDTNTSKLMLMKLVRTAVIAGVGDIVITRVTSEGVAHDETVPVLLALSISELILGGS